MINNLRNISFIIVFLILTLTFSCKKEIPKVIPTLTTTAISSITHTTASGGGSITSDGGAIVFARGVCWSTNQAPTTANSNSGISSGLSIFTSSIIGLKHSTTYYVRAYAINSVGTAYGNEVSFKTIEADTVDIDGNVYNKVTIGTQVWMKENLKTTKYRNGDLIGTTTPATLEVISQDNPKYQWAYAGNESNVATYGRLYTWFAASDSRKVCPTGWHVPTDSEWTTLITYLGGEAGSKLKEAGTSHWISPNTGATNTSGFTALPGGLRQEGGAFGDIGSDGYWWSSTEGGPISAWSRTIHNNNSNANVSSTPKSIGYSVRCLRD